jgi:hypothetical protein
MPIFQKKKNIFLGSEIENLKPKKKTRKYNVQDNELKIAAYVLDIVCRKMNALSNGIRFVNY